MGSTTLDYYDQNAEGFAAGTLDVKFTAIQDRFLGYLAPGALILDFGCGSGRDSRSGIPVKQMLFDELCEVERYDGIFACASILHVPSAALPDIFRRLKRAVKRDGIIYVSFKYGDFEGERNGRYFTDLTEERLKALLVEADPIAPLVINDLWITGDARPGRNREMWLNAILGCNALRRS